MKFPADPKHGQQFVEEIGPQQCIVWTFYQPLTEWRQKEYGKVYEHVVPAEGVIVTDAEGSQLSQQQVDVAFQAEIAAASAGIKEMGDIVADVEASVKAVEESVRMIRRAMIESKVNDLADRIKELVPEVGVSTMPVELPPEG